MMPALISSGTLLAVVLPAAPGTVLCLVLFVVALGRHDRAVHTAKCREVFDRRRLASAV